MNPGVSRLVIVAVLVVGGVAVLANGFEDRPSSATPDGTTSPTESPTPSPSPTEEPGETVVPNQEGVLVQVFNGTNEAGAAGDFQLLLEQENYLPAGDPADAPDKPVIDTIVYFRPDGGAAQNRADARLVAETYLDGAPVERLPAEYNDPAVTDPAADVVVVLGEDQVDQ
ncbi:MAG: LytR C-terminal domain-containing protein [Gemmatimonadota bacterium]